MYHVYKAGYSVLPQLTKLRNGKIFEVTDDIDFFIEEKEKACESQICFAEHDMSQEIYDDVCQFIVDKYPEPLEEPHTFDNIALQIQEDLAIHRLDDDTDWLAAAFICFPNMWRVEDKIGKSFKEIHKPVPKMQLDKSRELLDASIHKGPFERFVWTPVFERDRINYHPRAPKKKFDKKDPCIHCKVERQVIVGFPDRNALLFTMRQFIIPEEKIDLRAMYEALNDMGMDLERYNGIFSDFFNLKDYIREKTGIEIGFHTQPHTQQPRTGMGLIPVSQGPPRLPPPPQTDDDDDTDIWDWSGLA